ncbi:MAG: glycosyltransferase family 39 protein [Actinomycetota bacterium]|nr:glycosyltransferase family 39 protein [Actinomycetota bacterium]
MTAPELDWAPPQRSLASPIPPSILAVGALTVVGFALRLSVAHQSLFGDELSTSWISATHGLGGVLSLLYGTASVKHAEITPPLYFLASWLTSQIGHAPELLRLPSLVAGTLSIPVVYLLGLRTVGRRAALVATAVTTLSPFMIYYSSEARSYGMMMLLVLGSTLAMLQAIDTRGRRWWVLYAVCSCAAFYTHYTCVFVLGAQLLWLWWAHPEARRPALLANLGAAAGVLPWLPGLINELGSPTVSILSALSPFTGHDVRLALEHWSVGYPYASSAPLTGLPGTPALILLGLGIVIAAGGALMSADRSRPTRWPLGAERRIVLVLALAIVTPLAEALISAISTHIFGVRNLAASWPALALGLAALLIAAGRRLRPVVVALAVVSFAIGAVKMLEHRYERPNYQAVADFIAGQARPGDVVIDETGQLSPGPVTPLDVALRAPVSVFRAGSPAERDHPFGFFDPIVPISQAIARAVAAAPGGRIFVASTVFAPSDIPGLARLVAPIHGHFPAPYRLVESHVYAGIARTKIEVYSRGASSPG